MQGGSSESEQSEVREEPEISPNMPENSSNSLKSA